MGTKSYSYTHPWVYNFTHTYTRRVHVPVGYPAGKTNSTRVVHTFTLIDSISDKKNISSVTDR